MADFSEQQLADITQAVSRDLQNFGQVTSATADRLRDASVGIDGFSRSVRSSTQQFVQGMGELTSTAYRGSGALDQYNSTVRSLGSSASGLLSMFGGLGTAVGGLIRGFAELYSVSSTQLKNNYDTFKKLNQSGLFLGAELNDLIASGKSFGMAVGSNTEQQQEFINVLSKNSRVLAQYGQGTDRGRLKLEALSQAMEGQRAGLMALGFTMEDIAEGQAHYIKLQTEAGRVVTGTAEQQALAAGRYLRELRGLAEITGTNIKEQQAAREELLANQAFQAKVDEMRAQGQDKAADNLVATYEILRSQSKEMAQGFADMTTGNLRTTAAQKLQLSTQGQAFAATQDLAQGTASVGQTIKRIADGAGRQADNIRSYVKATGNEAGTLNNYVEQMRVARLGQRDLDREIQEAEARDVVQRAKLTEANAKLLADIQSLPVGSPAYVAAQEQLAKNQEQLRSGIITELTSRRDAVRASEQLDQGMSSATVAVTGALNTFKSALLDVSGVLLRLLGRGPGGAAPAGAQGAGNATAQAMANLQSQFPGARITSTTGGQHVPGSAHYQGRAFDVGLSGVSVEQKQAMMDMLRSMNPQRLDDESTRPSGAAGRYWSGPHIHAEFAQGGVGRGPGSGYLARLHGTEAVVPLPDGKSIPVMNNNDGIIAALRDLKNQINLPGGENSQVLGVLQDILYTQRAQNDTLGRLLQTTRA